MFFFEVGFSASALRVTSEMSEMPGTVTLYSAYFRVLRMDPAETQANV
jgi:hypothetical protein